MDTSQTDLGFRTSGFGSVSIQVVSLDPKVHKLELRSRSIDGGKISDKLETYTFPAFALIGGIIAKAKTVKCTLIIVTPRWPSQP